MRCKRTSSALCLGPLAAASAYDMFGSVMVVVVVVVVVVGSPMRNKAKQSRVEQIGYSTMHADKGS